MNFVYLKAILHLHETNLNSIRF